MSRVIIKNIPNKFNEEKLHDLFEQCGQVTDVKLQKCSSGKSRHFGFIGYRSDQEAQAAVKHFNKTFINSVRIEVEIAKPYGDPSIPRPWSKYAKGSSAYAKLKKQQEEGVATKQEDSADVDNSKKVKDQQLNHEVHKSKLTKVLADYYDLEKDPAFREFVTLHKKKDKRKTWSNELATTEHNGETESKSCSKPKVVPLIESVEAKRPGGKGIMLTRTHLKFEDSDSDSEPPTQIDRSRVDKLKVSDFEYLKSKVVRKVGEESEDHVSPEEDHMSVMEDYISDMEDCMNVHMSVMEDCMSSGEDPMSSSSDDEVRVTPKLTLKMRGLPFSATEQDIKDFFHPINTKEIRLVQTAKGRPSGRAFVDFYNEKDLQQSLQHDKDYMKNRYIELSIDLGPVEREEGTDTEKRDLVKRKKTWEVSTKNKEKDESLLDSGRLFARNLPYTVTEDDVTKLFEHYGPLTEVTLPVDKEGSHPIGYAFVTFVFPEHAVKAFEELDGGIFQGRLLHLMPSKNKDIENTDGE